MSPLSFTTTSQSHLSNTTYTTDLVTSTGVIFLISNTENTGITAFTYRNGNNRFQYKTSFRIQTSSNGTTGYTFDYTPPTEFGITSASELTCFGAGSNQNIAVNSVRATTCSNCNNIIYNPAVSNYMFVGANPGNFEYSNNEVAEIITYSTSLTPTQIGRIQSYLSIKYGINRGTNSNMTSTYDYQASDGSVVYSKTLNAGYSNDIAGIARDDASGLNKKQSISVNTSDPVTIGLGSIVASNAANANTFSSNLSFLLWGNNGLSCASVYSTSPSSLPATIQNKLQRVWKIQAYNFGGIGAGTFTTSPNVTVGFETSLLTGYTPVTSLRLLMDDDGTNWTNASVVSGAVLNGARVEFPNVVFTSAKKYFTLATIDKTNTPLPISLLKFTSNCDNGAVELNWKTCEEINCSNYRIERSLDGSDWIEIGKVAVQNARTESIHEYSFTDTSTDIDIAYYRLKAVDIDGNSHCYNLLSYSENCKRQASSVTVFPNPGSQNFQVKGISIEKVDVYDALGKLVLSESLNPTIDVNTINCATLNKGIYMLKISRKAGDPVSIKWINE